jgi:hypothetical protein
MRAANWRWLTWIPRPEVMFFLYRTLLTLEVFVVAVALGVR